MTQQPPGPRQPSEPASAPIGWCAGCLVEARRWTIAVVILRGSSVCAEHAIGASQQRAWWA